MIKNSKLKLYFDGGARGNPGPAAAGVVLHDESGEAILEAGYLLGTMTNNQAEYSAMLIGLQAANQCGAKQLTIFSDSELLVKQLQGEYRVKSEGLRPLFEDVRQGLQKLQAWRIHHVPRHENQLADELVNRTLDRDEDVVDVHLIDGPATLSPGGQGAPAPTGPTPESSGPARVLVEVVTEPRGKGCPSGCLRGTKHIIKDVIPGGFNLELAARIIEAIDTLRDRERSGDETKPLALSCGRCGAQYRISLNRDH